MRGGVGSQWRKKGGGRKKGGCSGQKRNPVGSTTQPNNGWKGGPTRKLEEVPFSDRSRPPDGPIGLSDGPVGPFWIHDSPDGPVERPDCPVVRSWTDRDRMERKLSEQDF